MTRKVFDNSMVAHVWAQQTQDEGRSNNGQFYFNGSELFSYGSHFLAGKIMPDGTALLNADTYSPSTGRHMRYAWNSVRHRAHYAIPDLTKLGDALSSPVTSRNRIREHIAARVKSYSDEAALYLLKLAGIKNAEKTLATIADEAERAAKKKAAKEARDTRKERLEFGARAAKLSDSEVDEGLARIANNGINSVQKNATKLHHAHRALKAAKHDKQAARVFAILQLARKLITLDQKKNAARDRNRYLQREMSELREGLTAIREHSDTCEAYTFRKVASAAKALQGCRFLKPATLTQLAAIQFGAAMMEEQAQAEAEERRERERAEQLQQWLTGESARFIGYGYETTYLRAAHVERDDSGAITGGTLETSRGADVPLTHAVRAFRFIKRVKQRGQAWKRNGHSVRVGHFTVDSVDASGNVIAGCHNLTWPEIERVARAVGVFEQPASDEALQA